MIVEGLLPQNLSRILDACRNVSLVAALPQAFFRGRHSGHPKVAIRVRCRESCRGSQQLGRLAVGRRGPAAMEAGPGLPVLNSLSAKFLADRGMKCVTLSPEADRRKLEELSAACSVPCSLLVFGRPPLLTTRAKIPRKLSRQDHDQPRGVRLIPRREQGLTFSGRQIRSICTARPTNRFAPSIWSSIWSVPTIRWAIGSTPPWKTREPLVEL